MEVGLVQKINIEDEMQQAYLDYAMSVIVSRALPDARDGLKPVHRRILYAMFDMGLRPDSGYKKSARIVGEVLGKYHPHGDMAVYEAMARMAQDFSMRVMLVNGQGNFGSIDGDPPAAMRYTEARLTAAAQHMLLDIQKNTVDFDPNFDDTLTEPTVLPAALPNLLVNGASGIAVGMSTSIPPHNLGEVIEALRYMLENWEKMEDINLENLMKFIQGPDFPTGGIIIQQPGGENLSSAYGTGRGRVTIQARAHLEEMERGRNRIIVTELPYLTNKSSLIERIAELVRDERLSGIADLRDESDRQGMRIVIELNKAADPQSLLRDLYKYTPMQSTFSIIMLALVDGEPRLLSLKQALRVYLDHRLEVIRRRTEFDVEKAHQRAHILEGLRVALKNLDEVINMIRQAPDAETARTRLMRRFKLSDIQAQAILDIQLRRLASLERKKIELEYKEVIALIKELENLLRSPKKMRIIVADELQAINEKYGDRRRTQVVHLKTGESTAPLTASELAPDESVWLVVSPEGLVSRMPESNAPRLSGSDAPAWLLKVNTRDTLYLVAEDGKAAAVALQVVPEADKPSSGIPYARLSALQDNDHLAAVFTLPARPERPDSWYIFSATHQGMVKKTGLSELPGPSASTFTLVRVNEGDRLGWLRLTNGQRDVLLLSASGMAIRFSEAEVRPMGLVAAGVLGMKLAAQDELIGMELLPGAGEVFMIASDGSVKRVAADQFPRQGRYGQGIVAWKLPAKICVVGLGLGKGPTRLTIRLDKLAPKMIRMDEAPLQTRAARGRAIQGFKPGDQVLSITIPWEVEYLSGKKTPGDKETTIRRPVKKAPVEELEETDGRGVQLSFEVISKPSSAPSTRKSIADHGAKKPAVSTRKPSSTAPKTDASKHVSKTTTVKKAVTSGTPKSAPAKPEPIKPEPAKTTKPASKKTASKTVLSGSKPNAVKTKPAASRTKLEAKAAAQGTKMTKTAASKTMTAAKITKPATMKPADNTAKSTTTKTKPVASKSKPAASPARSKNTQKTTAGKPASKPSASKTTAKTSSSAAKSKPTSTGAKPAPKKPVNNPATSKVKPTPKAPSRTPTEKIKKPS
jgi:DNA gyrase subunit A